VIPREEVQLAERNAGRKATQIRKPKDEPSKPGPPNEQAETRTVTQRERAPTVPSRLEKAISELQGLNELLLSGDLDPRILADFRDAVNRVRTAAWAAQQYVARKEIEQDSTTVFSFLAGERIRAAHHLCQAISEDLKRMDIKLPAGSLIQLFDVMGALTKQLKRIVNDLG